MSLDIQTCMSRPAMPQGLPVSKPGELRLLSLATMPNVQELHIARCHCMGSKCKNCMRYSPMSWHDRLIEILNTDGMTDFPASI